MTFRSLNGFVTTYEHEKNPSVDATGRHDMEFACNFQLTEWFQPNINKMHK